MQLKLQTGNIVYSVTELSKHLRLLVEKSFSLIQVKGEISGLKIASSGHAYFNLKDSSSIIAVTCWKGTLSKLNTKLEEGIEVTVRGKITIYAGQSKYQINAEDISLSGIGTLMQILEARKKKLKAEGLFATEHKYDIPFLPKVIGVITSITGSVIKDILHRISDRFPTKIVIWPVTVQGNNCSTEVENAIIGFNNIEKKPDVIIIARGGGSIEDLWAFNEENVIRACFASTIPVISAIGHETDFTLLDFVADKRAPTPTAAAEFVTPVLHDLQKHILHYDSYLSKFIKKKFLFINEKLKSSITEFYRVLTFIRGKQQFLDELEFKLSNGISSYIQKKELRSRDTHFSAEKMNNYITLSYLQIKQEENSLDTKIARYIEKLLYKYNLVSKTIEQMDVQKLLKRGFSIVTHKGNVIKSAKNLSQKYKKLNIRFSDGQVTSTIDKQD